MVYPFDYVSDEEPTMPNVNETWFKTDEAKIFKLLKIHKSLSYKKKDLKKEKLMIFGLSLWMMLIYK